MRRRALPHLLNLIPDLAICLYGIVLGVPSLVTNFNSYHDYKILVGLTFGFVLLLV